MSLDKARLSQFVDRVWDDSIVDTLVEYVRIPNKSPMFDPAWQENGHMKRAVALVEAWCKEHIPADAKMEIITEGNRTPLLLIDIPGELDDTILLYGHLDKQPEMVGWEEGLGPWTPVIRDEKLYGRGAADDGYAVFASLTAVNAVREQGAKHARCLILIECSEESGSDDLPFYIERLGDRIGTPSLVICLDAGCGNYDQLWCTTSLRGLVNLTLSVEHLVEGVHSGDAGGVVPDSFMVARALLERIEDSATGKIKLEELSANIPADRAEQAQLVGKALESETWDKFPLHEGAQPVTDNPAELVLNRTWRASLTVTGAAGLPALDNAGNVNRPGTELRLSVRIPPTVDAGAAEKALVRALTADPPFGARVTAKDAEGAGGWNAPPMAPWLVTALERTSNRHFGAPTMMTGEGGSIPFMGMLGEKFPKAQFMITGVLGPKSNAHGPNEFLHIPTARKLTACVADIIVDHAER